jgi:hypothetical protein
VDGEEGADESKRSRVKGLLYIVGTMGTWEHIQKRTVFCGSRQRIVFPGFGNTGNKRRAVVVRVMPERMDNGVAHPSCRYPTQ